MAGLDDLLGFVFKALEVAPSNTTERCLNSSQGAGSCRACLDACPHDAVRIGKTVEIDGVDCTGCGLCVRACPSEALEFNNRFTSGASARCSQVKGSTQSVTCLATLSATDVLRLAGGSGELTLAHGECAGCRIGAAPVPEVAQATADAATRLAEQLGHELTVSVVAMERFDDDRAPSRRLTRRQVLGGGGRQAKQLAAELIAPLERMLPVSPEEGELSAMPLESMRRFHVLELADNEPEQLVPWRLPRVDDGCILCPACTRACPTDAFSRDFAGPEAVLKLDPERCVGCNACVSACPVKVITMDDNVTWGELSGGVQEAYRSDPERSATGALPR